MPDPAARLTMKSSASLLPILLSAGILLGGNGLQVTLVSVRANIEGFPPALIGLLGTAYYIGFAGGCFSAGRLIRRVGHIRVFGALVALAAVGTLALVMWIDPVVWTVARTVTGFCFAGLSMVLESWLNQTAGSADRGRVLSLYRVVDLVAVLGAQFLMPLFGAAGFEVFAVVAMLFCLAIVPISLSRHGNPPPPESGGLNLLRIWRISPAGCLGCLTIGLTSSAFRIIGPVYAQEAGLAVGQIAAFIGAAVLGGALAQYPLGMLSDRIDRRFVLIATTCGAVGAGFFLGTLTDLDAAYVYAGTFLFGASAIPLYSLSIAHANDHAGSGDFVELAAGLILFFAIGASIGPFVASLIMARFGAPAFFLYTSVIHGLFVLFVFYRMARRGAVARGLKRGYVGLLRTSPVMMRIARPNGPSADDPK